MKKAFVIVLLCALVLSACGRTEPENSPAATEIKTLYFVQFSPADGEERAIVRYVENVDGVFTDTRMEDSLSFADDALIESFDLRLSARPGDDSITSMDLETLKEAAMLELGGSPVLYRAEIAEGEIIALRSEFYTLPAPEPQMISCPDCGGSYAGGAEFDGHECLPEPTPIPTPTPTPPPSPVAAGSPNSVQCPLCGEFYLGGHDYLNHACLGYSVACPVCGGWYEAGRDFLTHGCTNAESHQCPVCAEYFVGENAYLHHECVGYSVACPVCGEWYEAGYLFLTHPCVSAVAAAPAAPATGGTSQTAPAIPAAPITQTASAPAADTAGKTQCQTCGKYYASGHEFDTHFCQAISRTCPGCMMSMPAWKLNDHNCSGANYAGRTCENCGNYFMGYAYDAHICPGRVPRESCPKCGQLYHAGAELEAHVQSCSFVPSPVPCHKCGTPIYLEDYGPHMLVCPAMQ